MGDDVQPSIEDALFWLEKAANQGWLEASLKIAEIYFYGAGGRLEPDLSKPRHYSEIAAASEDADALYCLARMLETPEECGERINLLRLAAGKGHPRAQEDLATHYVEGQGVPKSVDDALHWCLRAADQGISSAQCNLFFLYSQKYGDESFPLHIPKVMYWLRKAAAQNDERGAQTLRELKEMCGKFCDNCKAGGPVKFKRCTRCLATSYCGKKCQLAHWKGGHKKYCIPKDIDDRSPEERLRFFLSS